MLLTKCRCCGSSDLETFVDLGFSPISNGYHASVDIAAARYPLKVLVCTFCEFLQLSEELEPSTHFNSNYPYFSGYSKTWELHCQATAAYLANRFGIDESSRVIEIASNDGTYVKNFLKYGSAVLGIEPSRNVSTVAEARGVPTIVNFFTEKLATGLKSIGVHPDLILGSNVLAHVPNIRDFLSGVSVLLQKNAVAVFEFPHATQMIKNAAFDTIYHEHYSYLNVTPLMKLCDELGLILFDIETHELHGGSLRIFISTTASNREISPNVSKILDLEKIWAPTSDLVRRNFQQRISEYSKVFKEKLENYKLAGLKIVIFGAAAKGTTLLNVANIDSRLIEVAVDSSLEKQNKYIPGTGIIILNPEKLIELQPDVIVILAWNFAEEIMKQASGIFAPKHSFLIPIPDIVELSDL